ncbi:MAG: hypothetical protein AAFV46_14080 [Cyanobacteria bacterium J06635_11]
MAANLGLFLMAVDRPSFPLLRSYLFYIFGVFCSVPALLVSILLFEDKFKPQDLFSLMAISEFLLMSIICTMPAFLVPLPPIMTLLIIAESSFARIIFGPDVVGHAFLFGLLAPSSWFFFVSVCSMLVKRRLWMLWWEWVYVIVIAVGIPLLAAVIIRITIN